MRTPLASSPRTLFCCAMVCRALASGIGRWAISLHSPVYWRHGACSRRSLAKDNKECGSSKKIKKSKKKCKMPNRQCRLTDPACLNPEDLAKHKPRLPEVESCFPDCREGPYNLPPRTCLPWEKDVASLCPKKSPASKLQSLTCEHICEPYVGQGLIDRKEMPECLYRQYVKCVMKTKDPKKCLDIKLIRFPPAPKCYPMVHAVQKCHVSGGPMPLPTPTPTNPTKEDDDCVI